MATRWTHVTITVANIERFDWLLHLFSVTRSAKGSPSEGGGQFGSGQIPHRERTLHSCSSSGGEVTSRLDHLGFHVTEGAG